MRITLAGTGENVVGFRGIRSLHSVMEDALSGAGKEVQVAVYRLGAHLPGFFELMENLCNRGVRITLIVNRIHEQPLSVLHNLGRLLQRFRNMEVYSYEGPDSDLHTKVLIVDRRVAIIGSANLTWRGMVENLEFGVVV
ncbi:MAG: phospholipase D family protein, partial [Thermofilaceae archaeon]